MTRKIKGIKLAFGSYLRIAVLYIHRYSLGFVCRNTIVARRSHLFATFPLSRNCQSLCVYIYTYYTSIRSVLSYHNKSLLYIIYHTIYIRIIWYCIPLCYLQYFSAIYSYIILKYYISCCIALYPMIQEYCIIYYIQHQTCL